MIVSLNLGSLGFGLLAWILPVVNLILHGKHGTRNWVVLSIISIGASAIALCLQIFNINHLVKIEDWSALMDTTSSIAFVSAVLLAGTILLNAIVLIVQRDRTAK